MLEQLALELGTELENVQTCAVFLILCLIGPPVGYWCKYWLEKE